ALLYDEPVALKRLNEAIATTQALLDRLDRGQGAAGVLVSPESTAAGKRFVAAMDRLARMVETPGREEGLLPGLLFDPKYKGTLEDLRATAKNLREISDRVAAGRGTLGALVTGSTDDGGLGTAVQDLKVAIHNLRSVSQKLSAGEGTLGALVADPTVYERLVTILEGAPRPLREISLERGDRLATGLSELDRVLGGGVVRGSLVLIGGDPGIGKSTLLLQAARALARAAPPVLYISAEESAAQVKMRADRLGIAADGLLLWTETDLAAVEAQLDDVKPRALVVDSIQTVFLPELESAPGSVAQVRECGARLMTLAKGLGIATFLVGHVTKEGALAGPRVLEHLVDTVLYFEGESHHAYRVLRAVKNRFGSTNEIGVFQMGEGGLAEVTNPSEFFLAERPGDAPGSVIVSSLEGTRPL